MLFVDAGNDHVSIGMSSDFGGVLNVNGGAVFDDATTFDPDTLANGRIGIGQIADGGGFAAQGIGWGGSSTGGTAALVASNGTMFLGLGDKASAGTLKTMLQLSQADVVVNQDSLDSDFRVESDDNTHMLFVDGGNDCVGIATSSPNTSGAALVVQANSAAGAIDVVGRSNGGIASISFYDDNGTSNVGYIQGRADDNEFRFWTTTSDIVSLGQNDIERARFEDSGVVFNEGSNDYDFRVESDGNANMLHVDGGNNAVGIGTTGQSGVLLYVDAPGSTHAAVCRGESTGFAPIIVDNTSGSGTRFLMSFRLSNTEVGSITSTGSTTSYTTSSDARLKENISDADDAGELIDAIQVRKFDWITDGEHQRYGMVAQELNTVAPEAVSAPEDPDEMMGVDYSKLVPMLVKEIQSLRARVAQLESN
jgi:regulator of extracellular matrix RemA (YlzA/DUF370 family)